MELTNVGSIVKITLPVAWEEDQHAMRAAPSGYLRRFSPPGNPDVKLCFYYRGDALTQEGTDSLAYTMEDPPHTLSTREIERLKEVLGDMSDTEAFHLNGARTAEHNGRRVLVVQGQWLVTEYETLHAFVDIDGSWQSMEEIYYTAPKESYPDYLKDIRSALKTIEWKKGPADLLKKMGRQVKKKK